MQDEKDGRDKERRIRNSEALETALHSRLARPGGRLGQGRLRLRGAGPERVDSDRGRGRGSRGSGAASTRRRSGRSIDELGRGGLSYRKGVELVVG